jgi:rubrerythrin
MAEAPSYLGLLMGISRVESAAHGWFTDWAARTSNADVRQVLLTVAAREGEHGMAFAKRVNELGFEVEQKHNPKDDEMAAIAASDMSDIEKFEAMELCNLEGGILTFFDNVFSDHTIDIRTGELLGRYIAEEHDTARLLRACYEELKAGADAVAVG